MYPATVPPATINLENDSAFMADPFPAFDRWAQSSPVHRARTPDGSTVWLVTHYLDVKAALSDRRLSLNKANSRTGYRGYTLPPALDANLLNLDPPDHTRLRRLVSQAFTARRMANLRPRVQEITDDLLNAIARAGRADLIAGLAAPLPVTVIGELLGVPVAERQAFRTWTTTLISSQDPARAAAAVVDIQRYLSDLIATKRITPGDDLLTAMIAARDEDDRLSEDELTSLAFLVLWAGYEATVDLIGNGLLELLRRPGQIALLRTQPALVVNAVEELLRYTAPNPYAIRRFATEDLVVGGQTISAGDSVLLCLASAHRDPEQFPEPDILNVTRSNIGHYGFGHGIHYCLGAPLARLEAEIAIGTVLRRFPALALDDSDPPRWRSSFRSRGLLCLPVVHAVDGSRKGEAST
ncbi:cytochrome P450 family protein [Solwaraspora sp. WMMA2101]|uniref:cytochrome P450 family protein n=1 Tax=Solwaraspora sp. WMMA2101 TaxID=3404124 RepID=UPI003B96415E